MSLNLEECEWQLHDKNEWWFGEKVRGIVRPPLLAEVYFTEGVAQTDYGWIWMVRVRGVTISHRGILPNIHLAVRECERILWENRDKVGGLTFSIASPEAVPPRSFRDNK